MIKFEKKMTVGTDKSSGLVNHLFPYDIRYKYTRMPIIQICKVPFIQINIKRSFYPL